MSCFAFGQRENKEQYTEKYDIRKASDFLEILAKDKPAEKGKFETTQDYENRIKLNPNKYAGKTIYIKYESIIYKNADYNADKEILFFKFDSIILRKSKIIPENLSLIHDNIFISKEFIDKFPSSTPSEKMIYGLEVDEKKSKERKYTGVNAFGYEVEVREYALTSYEIIFDAPVFDLTPNYDIKNREKSFSIAMKTPISEAREKLDHLGLAFGVEVNPQKTYMIFENYSKPKVSNPRDVSYYTVQSIVKPIGILIYDRRDMSPFAYAEIVKKEGYYKGGYYRLQPMQRVIKK
jgi:hypothetical protein